MKILLRLIGFILFISLSWIIAIIQIVRFILLGSECKNWLGNFWNMLDDVFLD